MAAKRLSSCFDRNVSYWKALGLSPGRKLSKFYIFYSVPYLFIALFAHNTLLTLNLIYTPRTIESLINETLFYFTDLSIAAKVSICILKRKEILEAFDLLDCDYFKGDDDTSKKIVEDGFKTYSTCFRAYEILLNIVFLIVACVPLILILAFGADRVLPFVKYYFLSDEIRDQYFMYLNAFQSFCMYTNMSYAITNDSFIAGLIWMAITQLKVINHKLHGLKLRKLELEQNVNRDIQERIMYHKLVQCLKHYELYLQYYSKVQVIVDFALFTQFGVAGFLICVILCGLTLLPMIKINILIFMVLYLLVITTEIFVPTWLGTQLTYNNEELVYAAYNSDWIPRSEKFKRSLRLFVERANKPMVLTGGKIFPMSLETFLSAMKLAYSSFTLVQNLKDQQDVL